MVKVYATGVAASASMNIALHDKLVAAMTQAVVQLDEQGITDDEVRRKTILAARDSVLDAQ